MKFATLDAWMRERANEPVLELCAHEIGTIQAVPLQLALSVTLEDVVKMRSLQGRVHIWARRLWGRACAYDKKRCVFILLRRKR